MSGLLRLLVGLLSMLVALGLPSLSFIPLGAEAPPAARAWVDAPLTGTSVPRGPVSVVGHATDPDGVDRIELAVDGALVATRRTRATRPGDADPPVLAMARLEWPAPAPGRHVLTLTGVDPGGERGHPAQVIVRVTRDRGAPEATPGATPRATQRATSTPRPRATPTPTPTPRPCKPPAPRLDSPPDFFLVDTPAGNPPTFRWGYARRPTCRPTGFVFELRDADGAVVIRRRVPGDVRRLTPAGELATCQTYRWSVRAVGPGGVGRRSDRRSLVVWYRC